MKRILACLVLAVAVAGCGGEESFDCEALGAELNRLDEQMDDLKASERSEKDTVRYIDDLIERGWRSPDSRHDPATLRAIQEEIRLLESDIRLIEADFRGVYGCSILDRFSSSGKRL